MKKRCIECNDVLPDAVHKYSLDRFNAPLCIDHQDWLLESKGSDHAKELYLELRKNGVPAQLEKYDGYKKIDIAIPECKVNIEVDGMHHSFDPFQALADLQRTYYSFLNGYITLRIPNSLIEWNIQDTCNYIVRFLNAGNERRWLPFN